MAQKFKLMWENNPETPINSTTLSEATESSSEYGGIIYKDIAELLPNGNHSDNYLKIRANSRVLIKEPSTRALLFNAPNTLVSHNSQFGPTEQTSIAFVPQSKNGTTSVYAGEGTTNEFTNPGFEDDFTDWVTYDETNTPPDYDPVFGEEYEASVTIANEGFNSDKSCRLFPGSFGRAEISRYFDLTGKPYVSISFYYKSEGGLRCYINSGSLFWKGNNWNQSASSFYELPATNGEWKRFEIKNILTNLIAATIESVSIYVYTELPGAESFVDSFQLEEKTFCSPYTATTRADSLLEYSSNIISAHRGHLDTFIYVKNKKDFSIFSTKTNTADRAIELIYDELSDQFQFRIYDISTEEYITVAVAARLNEQIDSWTRIICVWDENVGIKMIATSSPDIQENLTPYTPVTFDRIENFTVGSRNGTNTANIFIDAIKINFDTKDDIEVIRDFQETYIKVDDDLYDVFYASEEAIILDESMLDEGSYQPNTNYFVWLLNDKNDDTASIIISTSSFRPSNVQDYQVTTKFGGFKTDLNSEPVISSIWDITTKEDERVHAQRLLVGGVDTDNYKFDIRTQPYAEVDDIRATIPVNITNNFYARHPQDIYNDEVQYFELNNAGWLGIDNVQIDANQIKTRNYPDNLGSMNNDLDITTHNGESRVWIHSTEVDIDSGNSDIKLDDVRVDNNIIYSKELTDLYIDVSHTDNVANKNDLYIKADNITNTSTTSTFFNVSTHFNATTGADILLNAGRDIVLSAVRDITMTSGGVFTFDDIHIDENNIYNDSDDVHLYSTVADVDIDSGSGGQIELDDLHIKGNLMHRDSGDILIETPDTIAIGQAGNGSDPYTSRVEIRSDNFIVESQNITFTNVDAADFINFDDLKIRQSELYTAGTTSMILTSAANMTLGTASLLTLNSGADFSVNAANDIRLESENDFHIISDDMLNISAVDGIDIDTPNNVDISNTAGHFYSRKKSTFTDDLNVLNVKFTDVHSTDMAQMVMDTTSTTTKLKIQIADDSTDEIVLEHLPTLGSTTGNNMLRVRQNDIVVSGNAIIQGNLTINGDTTTLNVATLSVEDNIIELNRNVTGAPVLDSGITVNRGSSDNARFIWDESENYWRIDHGDGVLHNVIFNGYDARFSENVNIVTTEPAGFKLENDFAVGGMELLNPDAPSLGMSGGEAIMNMGLHMNHTEGYIANKIGYTSQSVGAWIRVDTRAAEKSFKWMWEESGSNTEKTLATLESNYDFTFGDKIVINGNTNDITMTEGNNTVSFDGTNSTLTLSQSGNSITANGESALLTVEGTNASIDVRATDTSIAQINVMGSNQGTGVVYVGQSSSHGGGFMYNGDDIPDTVGTTDSVSFFRRSGAVDTEVFYYMHNSDDVHFRGEVHAAKVHNAVWGDIAECWPKEPNVSFAYGQVVVRTENGIKPSEKRAEKGAFGVISNTYGYLLKSDEFDPNDFEGSPSLPVALKGTVPVALYGSVSINDELVSYRDGKVIKANWFEKTFKRDRILGRVDSIKNGICVMRVV